MAGSIAAVLTTRLVEGRWAAMPMVTGGFAIVFGTFTGLFDIHGRPIHSTFRRVIPPFSIQKVDA